MSDQPLDPQRDKMRLDLDGASLAAPGPEPRPVGRVEGDSRFGDPVPPPAGATPPGYAGYGAGFWLNTISTPVPVWGRPWGLPGAPRDAYFARGYLGQFLIIVPSEHLVVVRFGASHGQGGDVEGTGGLVRDVVGRCTAGARRCSRSSAAPSVSWP